MILIDAQGNKYWAHFRHVAQQITVRDLRNAFQISPRLIRGGTEFYISKKLIHKVAGKRDQRTETFWVTQCGFHAEPCPNKNRPAETPCEGVKLVGESVCSPLDIFLRDDGRKRALARAIKDLPRELRGQLWDSYFEQRRKFESYKHPLLSRRKRGGLRPLGR